MPINQKFTSINKIYYVTEYTRQIVLYSVPRDQVSSKLLWRQILIGRDTTPKHTELSTLCWGHLPQPEEIEEERKRKLITLFKSVSTFLSFFFHL